TTQDLEASWPKKEGAGMARVTVPSRDGTGSSHLVECRSGNLHPAHRPAAWAQVPGVAGDASGGQLPISSYSDEIGDARPLHSVAQTTCSRPALVGPFRAHTRCS